MSAFSEYVESIEERLATGEATELTHRSALEKLIESVDQSVLALNDPSRVECGAPDFRVQRDGFSIGHLEAKDLGTSLDEAEDTDQLQRYKNSLSNLVLTDYLEFRWFVDGEFRMSAEWARISPSGELRPVGDGPEQVLNLLELMLSHEPEPVADAEELAKRMAQAADMIDRIVVEALRQDRASQTLTDLREVTSEALIPDMDQPEKLEDFADMYAQTLSYGLFAARINHDPEEGDFERIGAAREIPKTNPFLRQLFDLITGADFEDEPYVGFVDDLVQLLANADIEAVLQDFGAVRRDNDEAEAAWQEDPVIHFYETFLKEYDPDLRRLRGVYYTPAPVVSYITRSVDHLLQEHFSLNGLVDRTTFTHRYRDDEGEIVEEEEQRVLVLDPACGTGTFLYHIVDHIRDQFRPDEAGMWNGYVEEHLLPRLFGFERMMAPYAVSHLKLGMQLAAQDLPAEERATWSYNFETDEDDYDDRLSIYLTDTLADPEEEIQQYPGPLRAVSEEAEAAAEVKNALPILAIVGNPPYSNFGQANSAPWVSDNLMMDWKPRGERKWNPDDFMKFMRWAEWKLNQTGQGVLAFITNRTYLDRVNRRRMRESLCDTFDSIYLLDLHGGIYETAPDEVDDHNVFDIRKGVAIVLFVKSLDGNQDAEVKYKSIWGDRDKKYNFLTNQDAGSVGWNTIDPEPPYYLFLPRDEKIADEYSESPKVQESFQEYTTGVQTNRDTLATDIHEGDLLSRIVEFSGASGSISEIEQKYDVSDVSYWRIREAQEELLEEGVEPSKIKNYYYRPFDRRYIYYSPAVVHRPRNSLSQHVASRENISLLVTRGCNSPANGICLVTEDLADKRALASSRGEAKQLFLYQYPSRRE